MQALEFDMVLAANENNEARKMLYNSSDQQTFAITLPPNGRLPLERHPNTTQTFIIMEGKGTASINGITSTIQPGKMIIVGHGVYHEIIADANSFLRIITIYSNNLH